MELLQWFKCLCATKGPVTRAIVHDENSWQTKQDGEFTVHSRNPPPALNPKTTIAEKGFTSAPNLETLVSSLSHPLTPTASTSPLLAASLQNVHKHKHKTAIPWSKTLLFEPPNHDPPLAPNMDATVTQVLHPASNNGRVRLVCGKDQYLVDEETLLRCSYYFHFALPLQAQQKQFIKNPLNKEKTFFFPLSKWEHVRTIVQFIQVGVYHGRSGWLLPAWECSSTMPCTEPGGFGIFFRSNDPKLLEWFPEFGQGCHIHGHAAEKAFNLIYHHELYDVNDNALIQCNKDYDWKCQPDRLPLSIQFSLYNYLHEVRTRVFVHGYWTSDVVFHAEMFRSAAHYMFYNLKPAIANAFRSFAKPWINTVHYPTTSFATAMEIIYKPMSVVDDGEHWELKHALAAVLGANWGWMRHEQGFLDKFVDEKWNSMWRSTQLEIAHLTTKWQELGWVRTRRPSVW